MLRTIVHITLFLLFGINAYGQINLNFHSDYERKVLTDFVINDHLSSTLELQLIVDKSIDEQTATNAFNNYNALLEMLKNKKTSIKSEAAFLNWMFYKVHRKALKNYKQYVTLAETLTNGNYDCLTATSLYAQLLTDLGFKPEVIETTYHIYLMVNTSDNQVLFESTDPINGFVISDREIASRIEGYKKDISDNANIYRFENKLDQSVDLMKLAGLQYFNTAVLAYNSHDLLETVALLEKAILFYHSNRITEFGIVLANAISNDSEISNEVKLSTLNRVADFIKVDDTYATR